MLRALGHELAVAPVLDAESGLPLAERQEEVLCHASLANHLPQRIVGELTRIAKSEGLPPVGKIASVGCRAGAALPLSCSPAAMAACSGTVLLWAPMISHRDGFQQAPHLVARDLLHYAAERLEQSRTLTCVMVLVPQAAPGRSHWGRWWPVESRAVEAHCVGHVELAFGGQHWGVYALTRAERSAERSVWVRSNSPAPGDAPQPRPPADDAAALQRFFLGGARRWVAICDQHRLASDTRRPRTQVLQAHVLSALGLGWLEESAVTPLPLSGRFVTVRLDLSGATARLKDIRERRGEEETAEHRDLLAKVVQRCAAWDGEAALQLGCQSGVWIVDGDVWDRAETLDVTLDGTAPPAALRRCREPVLAACHELAGFVRLALPRNHTTGLRLTVLPCEGQAVADLDAVLQGSLRIRSAVSDAADRRQVWPLEPGGAVEMPTGHADQLQMRVVVEAGAPQRLLRTLADALGAEVSSSAATGDGGRAVVVRQLRDGAALLHGATVQQEG